MKSLSSLTIEELADGICLRAGCIAAAEAEQLPWIAEFDRREGWAGTGMLSCAHWLSWRTGLSLGAARDQVRVACRLEELSEVAAGFGEGRISYSKVRAITRVAESDDGIDWVELARHSSAAQLEKIVRGVRRTQANAAAELDPEAAAWSLRTRVRYDDAGNFTLTISDPAEYLPVVQAGIEAKKAELQRQRDAEQAEQAATAVPEDVSRPAPEPDPEPEPEPEPELVVEPEDVAAETPGAAKVTDAQALLALAQDALAAEQQAHPAITRRRRPQLTAQIDPISGWGRLADGELLPPSSLRAVMRTLPGRGRVLRLRPVTAADLRRHDLGRTSREANAALRELLGTLDGERCRFPGCTRRKKLHAHHVVYWSDGGSTDLNNLVKHEAAPSGQGREVARPRFTGRAVVAGPLMQLLAGPSAGGREPTARVPQLRIWSRNLAGVRTGGFMSTSSVRCGSPEISATMSGEPMAKATRKSSLGSAVARPDPERGSATTAARTPMSATNRLASSSLSQRRNLSRASTVFSSAKSCGETTSCHRPSRAASSRRPQSPRGVIAAATSTFVSGTARGDRT
ncbi:MAG: DUF222 domain-containing protein [Mycobacteriales bacterium]